MSNERKKFSYERINYILRPRKQIERKLIIETLQKLRPKINIEKYKYIGLGSIYYYDFILFHKFLNMKKMLSIDDKETEKRFKFNKPYEFIDFQQIKSTNFLLNFDWNENVIIWLDYDDKLKDYILADIGIVTKNCNCRDFLIFTINVECPSSWNEREEFRNNFKKYISPEYQHKKFITPRYFTNLVHNICQNYIKEKELYRDMRFYQIFSFKYQDRAHMFTMGGIFDENNEIIEDIKHLDFISTGKDIIEIDVPILTPCEKFHLDQNIKKYDEMMKEFEKKITFSRIKDKKEIMKEKMNKKLPFELYSIDELKSYIKYYKYFPQYFEGII